MIKFIHFFLIIVLCIFSIHTLDAQVTGASLKGSVTDDNDHNLSGATIQAEHIPSGIIYGAIANNEGFYRITGMRVGGPYRIKVSYVGYGTFVLEDVNLRLGESEVRDFILSQTDLETKTIYVTAKAGSAGQNSGTSTQISLSEIENLPTINRNFYDFLRLTPQSGEYGSGLTVGGVNNRYNSLYIDGAINNDVFGLSYSGTNGGQTGITPFSLDILEQLQMVVSPYDVAMSGFAGGSMNAVTKSGTNEFKGSVYQYIKNEDMVGRTNGVLSDRFFMEREKVDEFVQRQYGLTFSGPIIENKLFFFTNIEIQDDNSPVPFSVSEYTGMDNRASVEDLDNLKQHLIDKYNYDPGQYGSTSTELEGLKFFGKINYFINPNHQLSLRHQYTKANMYNRFSGRSFRINFSNNGVYFPSVTNSSSLELNSLFGNKYSNNFILSFVSVRDNRGTLGERFPYVVIHDGSYGTINFGSEQYSTANQLDQNIFSITNNFQIFKGSHTITIGTHNEFYNIYNLFLRRNFGFYEFDSIDDFINDEKPSNYQRTYALDGDGSADFNAMQLGIYVQDEWRVTKNFTLSGGIRLDMPLIIDDPKEDLYFNNTALPLIRQKWEIASNTQAGNTPDLQYLFSPRLGFTYNMEIPVKTVVRGGAGIFTSRIPFVWLGSMFINNGMTVGGVTYYDVPEDFRFNPDPDNQITNPNFIIPSGQMDLFTEDFKYPQMFRTNLAFDFELPFGIYTTLEGVFTKKINDITYTNINSNPEVDFHWTGSPDDRPIYTGQSIDDTYSAVYLASNTSEGYSYNLAASFAKNFDFGLRATLAYSWSEAESITEGTHSQNSAQWMQQKNINGRNYPQYGRSDFAVGHRILSSLSYTHHWTNSKLFGTTISLYVNAQSGSPYSYVIAGAYGRNINRESGYPYTYNSLVYIPENSSDINLVDYTSGDRVITAEEQWQQLDAFIEDDSYLSKNRGQYSEKNAAWAPFSALFDLSIRQDIGINIAGQKHRFQLSVDIFNFSNMLYNEWGTIYAARGEWNKYYLYSFEGYEDDGTTPQFTFRESDTGMDKYDIYDMYSRWKMQIGIRYIFN